MKKSFIISLLAIASFFMIQNFAEAESVLEPQWAEFCPPLYENAVFKPAKQNSKRNMENNYWALRKVKFEKSVAECKAYSKTSAEPGACYSRIVNLENNKNKQRGDAKYEKQMDERNQIRDGGYWWY